MSMVLTPFFLSNHINTILFISKGLKRQLPRYSSREKLIQPQSSISTPLDNYHLLQFVHTHYITIQPRITTVVGTFSKVNARLWLARIQFFPNKINLILRWVRLSWYQLRWYFQVSWRYHFWSSNHNHINGF